MEKLKIIGHRGARGLAPENTIAGFKKAIELGVDMIEFDVRVTKQGVPVLHHDRLPNDPQNLLTLDDALKFINDRVILYVEVKPREATEPIVSILKKYNGRYWLGSKSQKTLLAMHEALPKIPKIVIESWSGVVARHRAKQLNTKLLAMNQRWLWSGFISAIHRSGYQLFPYTLNNPRRAKRWAKHGLTGIVTDRPDLFKNI